MLVPAGSALLFVPPAVCRFFRNLGASGAVPSLGGSYTQAQQHHRSCWFHQPGPPQQWSQPTTSLLLTDWWAGSPHLSAAVPLVAGGGRRHNYHCSCLKVTGWWEEPQGARGSRDPGGLEPVKSLTETGNSRWWRGGGGIKKRRRRERKRKRRRKSGGCHLVPPQVENLQVGEQGQLRRNQSDC